MTKLLSLGETAPILNLSIITIRRLIKKREIPFHRIGHKYLFTEEDIHAILSESAVPIGGIKNDHSK
jgi:excisionase family DNA binding protein